MANPCEILHVMNPRTPPLDPEPVAPTSTTTRHNLCTNGCNSMACGRNHYFQYKGDWLCDLCFIRKIQRNQNHLSYCLQGQQNRLNLLPFEDDPVENKNTKNCIEVMDLELWKSDDMHNGNQGITTEMMESFSATFASSRNKNQLLHARGKDIKWFSQKINGGIKNCSNFSNKLSNSMKIIRNVCVIVVWLAKNERVRHAQVFVIDRHRRPVTQFHSTILCMYL